MKTIINSTFGEIPVNKTELTIDQLKRRSETNTMRQISTLRTVKRILIALPEPVFIALVRECLHRNHFHLLESYLKYVDESIRKDLPKKVTSRSGTLSRMYRGSITTILCELTPDGYSPEIVEWLFINKYL